MEHRASGREIRSTLLYGLSTMLCQGKASRSRSQRTLLGVVTTMHTSISVHLEGRSISFGAFRSSNPAR